jgi:hypothetical protein
MDNLNLESDESVIYTSQKIISSGTGYEVILTDRRFILAESGTATIREDLPYTSITLATPGFNKLREPVIYLTITAPDESVRQLELIFVYAPGGLNVQDRDKCLVTLRARGVHVEGLLHQPVPPSAVRRDSAGAVSSEGENARPAVPTWTAFGTSRYIPPKAQEGEEAPLRSPLFTIIAAVLVIGLLAGGVIIAFQLVIPKIVPRVNDTAAGGVTVAPGESVVPTPATPSETTAASSAGFPGGTNAIPANGVWVRVSYPGNFSGTVGAEGWMTGVNGSGTRLYQLPVHDTLIEGSVDKLDGSADILDVEIYNGGSLVSGCTTAKPWGSVDLSIPLGPALVNVPVTVAPTLTIAAPPTPDTSLILHEVPPNGIWVRVAYPGNFSGTLTANGQARDVNSTGDQFYQLSMKSGLIEGSIAKADGSVRNLIVEVYRDGVELDRANTSVPLGTVDINTQV